MPKSQSRSRIRNVRLQPLLDQLVTEREERTGENFAELARKALCTVLEVGDLETALIDGLGDFETATFAVSTGPSGQPAVEVADVERRTHIPGFPDRPYRPTKAPLTQFVRVEARRENRDRVAIELVGLPPDFASTRVFVASLPVGVDASVTVRLEDLNPRLRPEEMA